MGSLSNWTHWTDEVTKGKSFPGSPREGMNPALTPMPILLMLTLQNLKILKYLK